MKLSTALRSLLMFVAVIVINSCFFGRQACENIVLTWNNVAIRTASANSSRGLLMVRALAIMHTAMFDAWSQVRRSRRPDARGTSKAAKRPSGAWRISEK